MLKTLLYVIFLGITALAQTVISHTPPTLHWQEFHAPIFPQEGRMIRLQGHVIVQLTIQADGKVSIQKKMGHPLLMRAVEESLRTSSFKCENCSDSSPVTVVYDFKIAENCGGPGPEQKSEFIDPEHISIVTKPICISGPKATYKKVRGARCLYLWRCALRPE